MSRLFPSLPACFRQSVRRCQPVRPSFGFSPTGRNGSIPWFPSFDCNSILSPFPGFVKGWMKKISHFMPARFRAEEGAASPVSRPRFVRLPASDALAHGSRSAAMIRGMIDRMPAVLLKGDRKVLVAETQPLAQQLRHPLLAYPHRGGHLALSPSVYPQPQA